MILIVSFFNQISGIYQKKRVIDLEEAVGEESKVRVKRGGKQPGKQIFPKHRDIIYYCL